MTLSCDSPPPSAMPTPPTILCNAQGERLDHAFHSASDGSGELLVLIGHGVTGNKDRPWAVALAEALAAAGYSSLRFSFSGNGDSEGDFRDSTITKEVADLRTVVDAVTKAGFSHIAYAGHSMGGAVGVLAAAADPRLERLISLAGMVYTATFAATEFGEATPGSGFMWEKPECPLSEAFVNDMNAIENVLSQAPDIRVPWLLVHGEEDDVVPIQESRDILARAGSNATFVSLPGVDHVFSSERGLAAMIATVLDWLGK